MVYFMISIHAPHTGRDSLPHLSRRAPTDFNPRAPYGARRRIRHDYVKTRSISIHAPHTGRDDAPAAPEYDEDIFQSTRPIRGATKFDPELEARLVKFQSTRPIRGATRRGRPPGLPGQHFNPRAPYGARQSRICRPGARRAFQSTRPIRGATW